MNYHVSNIKRELVKVKHETLDTKIFLLIDPLLEKGVAITKAQIKAILQKAYDDLGVTEKAAASHLNRWYYIKETTKRVNGGSPQGAIAIIRPKMKVG